MRDSRVSCLASWRDFAFPSLTLIIGETVLGRYRRNRVTRQGAVSITRILLGVLGGVATAIALVLTWVAIDGVSAGRALVWLADPVYEAPDENAPGDGSRPAADPSVSRDIPIAVAQIATGFKQPTDIQFPPGIPQQALVLEKGGVAKWLKVDTGVHGKLLEVHVLTASEEGLLGAAFHPDFAKNGRLFLHYVTEVEQKDMSRVEEWRLEPANDLVRAQARAVRTVLEVEQPYQNHNAGQLAFGPDGYLYIGYGDGGFRDDPHDHGQDTKTWLGSMLRVDVNVAAGSKQAYQVPKDNPFVGRDGFAPETFAYGLRNPWRYSFDPKGRLIVADVGQDRWEEIDIVQAGDNLGWKVREGFVCAKQGETQCELQGAIDPIHVYPRAIGASITGGYVYLGETIPQLRGKYVFGDFVSGRMFALDLPDDRTQRVDAKSLGKLSMLISTFGRDHAGELYVGSYGDGRIVKLELEKKK
jgi:glucose/arabinose dehydrogenase